MQNIETRDILCIDMDAFFASVEQASNPNLRGKAIAVIGAKERSVIVTASYEARKKGVKTGMNSYQADKICPTLQYVTASVGKYTTVSKGIAEILQTITPDVAMYSIDEAFIDITGTGLSVKEAAYLIKTKIREKYGITCTIGAGNNRLIAKLATSINKPDGFYRVTQAETIPFIDSHKLSDIWGVGRKTTAKLTSLGLYTPKAVREYGEENLTALFGINGKILHKLVSGESENTIPKYDEDMKSIGHSFTVAENLTDTEGVYSYLLQLAEMVSARARKNNYSGKTVTLTVRFSDMNTVSFRKTIDFRTSATHHIYYIAKSLFDANFKKFEPIRLLGISITSLDHLGATYANIEDMIDEKQVDRQKLYEAMDQLNTKFGKRTVTYASVLKCRRKGSSVIAPSWKPDGERSFDLENPEK